MMRSVLSPKAKGQDKLIVKVKCWGATRFFLSCFAFNKHVSHGVVRVGFHAEGSAEAWSGEGENTGGVGLHGFSLPDYPTFAGGLLKKSNRDQAYSNVAINLQRSR